VRIVEATPASRTLNHLQRQSVMIRKSLTLALVAALTATSAFASSHREAPLITETPKVDGTDFYLFRSYEQGRDGFVTLIANYLPLQDPYGGPNYFTLDPAALYEIHIDNDGDAREDLTFQFRFKNQLKGLTVPVNGVDVAVPLVNIGSFGTTVDGNDAVKNVIETYSIAMVRGDRGNGASDAVRNLSAGGTSFRKPFDNIGGKSFPDYQRYADSHIHRIGIPGCASEGRVFVGQRQDGFSVNLGEVFDLINTNPLGATDGEANTIADKNITTLALELPIACITSGNEAVIGAWTTASLPRFMVRNEAPVKSDEKSSSGRALAFTQVSRLSAPLVNELVIGLPDKDRFNGSEPRNDGQFAAYVTNPTLPELIEILFNAPAPNQFPRTDLVAAFLTGLDGLNRPANVRPAEMMRLNTRIAPVAANAQSNLGALGGDIAGFPNGRRPGDDVVDIELRVAMGALLPEAVAPAGKLPITDGATVNAGMFRSTFPYLNTPIAGSPAN
jgi:hypothetical protein